MCGSRRVVCAVGGPIAVRTNNHSRERAVTLIHPPHRHQATTASSQEREREREGGGGADECFSTCVQLGVDLWAERLKQQC